MEAFLQDDRKVPSSPHLLALRDKYVARRALWRQKYLEALPESERAAAETIALPIYAELGAARQERVVQGVVETIAGSARTPWTIPFRDAVRKAA